MTGVFLDVETAPCKPSFTQSLKFASIKCIVQNNSKRSYSFSVKRREKKMIMTNGQMASSDTGVHVYNGALPLH